MECYITVFEYPFKHGVVSETGPQFSAGPLSVCEAPNAVADEHNLE
jgi:hypothetical protein